MKKTSYLSKKNSKKSYANWIIVYIIMIALVLFTALPLIYVVVTAFKPLDELFIYPPRFFVKRPTLRNFVDLLGGLSSSVVPFTRYIFNSFFTTAVIVAVTVLISSAGAYGLVKQNVPFGNAIFNIMKDRNTNRLYKIYDFTKTACFEPLKPYCISGKVNSADKIYLVLEKVKEDKKNYQNS
jgi:ABC-type multidrug transport system fused ATPase/permease subunit